MGNNDFNKRAATNIIIFFLSKACTRNKCERISTSFFFSDCIKIFLIALYFVYNVLWFQKNMLVFGFNLKLVLKMTKEEDVKEKTMHKYLQNPNSSYNSIAKLLQIHPYTVSRVIQRFSQTKSIKRKSGGERKEAFKDIKLVRKLVYSFKNNPSLSLRERAKIYGFSHSFDAKVRNKHGFHSFKAQKVPNRSETQQKSARTHGRKLYDNFISKNFCIIEDDETYIKYDHQQIPGAVYYISKYRGKADKKFKCTKHDKFAKKALIWQAICSCGIKSASYISQSTLSGQIYVKECLQKRLLPLIKSHNNKPVFSSDLASIHYCKLAMEWYKKNNVKFVAKTENLPNCQELRVIKKYWAIIKRKMKKTKKLCSNIKDIKISFKKASNSFDSYSVCKLMGTTKEKTRNFIRFPQE